MKSKGKIIKKKLYAALRWYLLQHRGNTTIPLLLPSSKVAIRRRSVNWKISQTSQENSRNGVLFE